MLRPKNTAGRTVARNVFYDGDEVTITALDEKGRPTEIALAPKLSSKIQLLDPSEIRNPYNRTLIIGGSLTRANGYFYPTDN